MCVGFWGLETMRKGLPLFEGNFFDFFRRENRPVSNPFTDLFCLFPSIIGHEVWPEGKGATLLWPSLIELAFFFFQEDTVIIFLLDEGESASDSSRVLLLKCIHIDFEKCGHPFDFFLFDIDITRGSCAASSTLGTLKADGRITEREWGGFRHLSNAL